MSENVPDLGTREETAFLDPDFLKLVRHGWNSNQVKVVQQSIVKIKVTRESWTSSCSKKLAEIIKSHVFVFLLCWTKGNQTNHLVSSVNILLRAPYIGKRTEVTFWLLTLVRLKSILIAEILVIYRSKWKQIRVLLRLMWFYRDETFCLPVSTQGMHCRSLLFACPVTNTNWSLGVWDGHVVVNLARGWLLVFTPNYTQQVITIIAPYLRQKIVHADLTASWLADANNEKQTSLVAFLSEQL